MEIKEWASLQTGGHLHCVTIMRHCWATSVFYLKHKTKRKRERMRKWRMERRTEGSDERAWGDGEVIRIPLLLSKEMSGTGWEKWKCLHSSFLTIFPFPTSLSLLSSPHFLPSFSFSHHHLPAFLPSFISPAYLICIHLLTDLLCHKTANYLICLLPLFPSITSLPPTSVFASHLLSTVSLSVLHLLVKFFPSCPACSLPPPSPPCSLGSLADSFRLVVWPLKNRWSNSAAHPIRNDSEGRKAERDEGEEIRSDGL